MIIQSEIKVMVIGYGSMGKRRIRILKSLLKNIRILCVENNLKRLEQAKKSGMEVFPELDIALLENPNLAFVCTSPGEHGEIILKLVDNGIHVFTELNLIDDHYDEIIKKSQEKNVIVFMSSTLLYNKEILSIYNAVKRQVKPLTYIYHVGQYLPDWHPWEDYRDFFIGKKETNGVREIFAIQLPWIVYTFGKIKKMSAFQQKCTNLDIDFNDSITVNFQHENGTIGVFVADTVSRKVTTHLEVIGENLHIFWDGHVDDLMSLEIESGELKKIKSYESVIHNEGYADTIIENEYIDEIQSFLNVVYKGHKPRYILEDDRYILSLIDEIEGLK